MFDLRYHVASLAAVFLALMIGIVVGVGISDRGFLQRGERSLFQDEIADLNRQVEALRRQQSDQADELRAARALLREGYPELVRDRLLGKRVAVVFVGSADRTVSREIERALADAGAQLLRMRALKVPVDHREMSRVLSGRPALASYAGEDDLRELGRAFGQELVTGGETPLSDGLSRELVEERIGTGQPPADAVVVARSVEPQRAATARFLGGLYSGLASSGVPAIGVEASRARWSSVDVFRRAGVSSVDSIDTIAGRLALVLLAAGGQEGHYGFKRGASDGPLPPLASVPPPATTTRG
jgi:hypothetical protein